MNIHALVVDDSGIMRKMVMRALREAELAQFMFTEATDGLDALSKFDPKTMDMIFVDWNMPNMNGLEFIKKLQATQPVHTPVVMITTEGTCGKIDEAMSEAKVDKYIAKPFTVEDLRKRLAPVFEQMAAARKDSKGFFSKLADKLA
jgi:two-component system chemotaxis response regulator CheY